MGSRIFPEHIHIGLVVGHRGAQLRLCFVDFFFLRINLFPKFVELLCIIRRRSLSFTQLSHFLFYVLYLVLKCLYISLGNINSVLGGTQLHIRNRSVSSLLLGLCQILFQIPQLEVIGGIVRFRHVQKLDLILILQLVKPVDSRVKIRGFAGQSEQHIPHFDYISVSHGHGIDGARLAQLYFIGFKSLHSPAAPDFCRYCAGGHIGGGHLGQRVIHDCIGKEG